VRRLVVLSLAFAALATSAATAEDLTKRQIINRSAPICRDLLDAIQPHIEKLDDATSKGQWDRVIREGRRAIGAARPYGRELRALRPETGARRYGRFLEHARLALTWLERSLDALEEERLELARGRRETALRHFARARRAAKRYGLRRPCIKVVS
jgi:hypothetical protein